MLMDCGSSQEKELGKDCLVPFLKSWGVDRLDTVFISHGDWDHISGIRYALEDPGCGIRIGHAGDAGAGKGERMFMQSWPAWQTAAGSRWSTENGEMSFPGSWDPEVSIRCLSPPEGGDYGDPER